MTTKPDARPQPMPMERAILWNPSLQGDRTSGRAPYPIFFQQEAVIALQEHLKSSPLQAIFGFLIGNLHRDPETGVLYAVIDKTLRLNQAIYGDKTEIVVSRLWERMQQQLEKASGQLLGWYHSHPGQGGSLTPHDVETHEKYFTDPWQVAVLVAAEAGGVTGRFFRAGSTADWAKTPLSFYELLQPDSISADGKKRSFITWRNYKAFHPISAKRPSPPPVPPPPPAPPGPPPPAPAPPPEQEQDDEDEQEDEQEDEAEAVPDEGFRIMRSSADDLPIIRTSMDDEAAPAAPIAPPPPPPPPRASKPPPQAPVFFPDEPPVAPYDPGRPPELMHVSDPIPPPPPPAPFSPSEAREARRTSTHTFRLLDEEAPPPKAKAKGRRKGRRRWLSRLAMLLILGGVAAAGYWYFVMQQHGAEFVTKVRATVSRWTASSPPAPPPATPPAAARPAAAPRAAPPPAPPAPSAAPVDTTFARFDRLSDTLSRAVRGYHERAALFAGGQIDCATLARGLVAIENLWISYNTERRARMSAFDSRRAARDQGLYAGVDSVESQFERSGCSRP